jgi:AcrR family transcriptional regulator
MQTTPDRTPNPERTARTRAALLAAARERFARDGYAAVSTPDICAAAGLTRGALYHHFADKLALFAAVVEAEQAALMAAIEAAATAAAAPFDQLVAGGDAFLAAMEDTGRQRLLLLDGPAVLPPESTARIEAAGRASLAGALRAAIAAGQMRPHDSEAMADLLNALYDRAALMIAREGDPVARAARRQVYGRQIGLLLAGLRTY